MKFVLDCSTYDQNTFNYCQTTTLPNETTYRQEKQYYDQSQYLQEVRIAFVVLLFLFF